MYRFVSLVMVSIMVTIWVAGCEEQALTKSGAETTTQTKKLAAGTSKTVAPAPAAEPGPHISFEKTVHDFGDVGPDSWNVCEFSFKNTGDQLLKIGKVRSNCGCTVPDLSKLEYQPGEEGVIKVKYHGDKQPGRKSRTVTVPSNDPAKPKITLAINVNIVLKVKHKPAKLELALNKDNAGCPTITLESIDGQPFGIKGFKSTKNAITVDYDSSTEALSFVLEPVVNTEVLKKQLMGNITIMLTHPECRTVTVPYRTKPPFKLSPPSIVLFDARPENPVKKEVWLTSGYGDDMEIASTSSQKGYIKVVSQEKIGDRYKFNVEITAPSAGRRKRVFTDVLTIKLVGGDKVDLVCRGVYPKGRRRPVVDEEAEEDN